MSQRERDTIIHLVAGGVAGTVGAVVTCPLEVVKTRLQSSSAFLYPPQMPDSSSSGLNSTSGSSHTSSNRCTPTNGTSSDSMTRPDRRKLCTTILSQRSQVMTIPSCAMSTSTKSVSIMQCLRLIVQTEGSRALFKGLGPNIVGVAPSRAIYFCAYSQTKSFLNNQKQFPADSPIVHIMSASCAGFAASTTTNPIWFIKTRLQLDYNSKHKMTVAGCIRRIYQQSGLLGFYKGISASYVGISETVIHFVIYEALKAKLIDLRETHPTEGKTSRDFLEFMLAGACSKTIASCIAYPHEVARTRLREEGNKYRSFWQTLRTVYAEEGKAGIYRGLGTQLVRQIPNTAIMMATYEAVVYVLTRHFNSEFYSS